MKEFFFFLKENGAIWSGTALCKWKPKESQPHHVLSTILNSFIVIIKISLLLLLLLYIIIKMSSLLLLLSTILHPLLLMGIGGSWFWMRTSQLDTSLFHIHLTLNALEWAWLTILHLSTEAAIVERHMFLLNCCPILVEK